MASVAATVSAPLTGRQRGAPCTRQPDRYNTPMAVDLTTRFLLKPLEAEMHQTERAYDDEMAPLITQLIEVAKREGIPLFVSAGMLDAEGEQMGCTTLIPSDGHSGFDTASALTITRHRKES